MKSTCLTKEIFYQLDGSEVKSIVMEKNKTLNDLQRKIHAKTTVPNLTIEQLDETEVRQINLNATVKMDTIVPYMSIFSRDANNIFTTW